MNRTKTIFLLLILYFNVKAQVLDYKYCNCIDSFIPIEDSLTLFKRICSNSLAETGVFKNGIPYGTFKVYGKDNAVMKTIDYKEGVLDGAFKIYNKKNELILEAYFKEGAKDKNWKYYNQDGVLKIEGSYSDNMPIGVWKYYSDSKELVFQYDFDSNKDTNKELTGFYNSKDVKYMFSSQEFYFTYPQKSKLTFENNIVGGVEVLSFILNNYLEINKELWNTYYRQLYKVSFDTDTLNSTIFEYKLLDYHLFEKGDNILQIIMETNLEKDLHKVSPSSFSINYQLLKSAELLNLIPPMIYINKNFEFYFLIDVNFLAYRKK